MARRVLKFCAIAGVLLWLGSCYLHFYAVVPPIARSQLRIITEPGGINILRDLVTQKMFGRPDWPESGLYTYPGLPRAWWPQDGTRVSGFYFFPLWIPVSLVIIAWLVVRRLDRPFAIGACPRCGYDLRGLTADVEEARSAAPRGRTSRRGRQSPSGPPPSAQNPE